jgi:hypothetical protein
VDKSTTLSGNNGPFSAKRTDFLQYSLESGENFIGDEYMGGFTRVPPLFSHTMDGPSSFPGQEYEATTYTRAPLLRSYTMDGFASHTSYQPVCHYEASAQARIPSVEYMVDRRQSITNEEMTALYGTPQTI